MNVCDTRVNSRSLRFVSKISGKTSLLENVGLT